MKKLLLVCLVLFIASDVFAQNRPVPIVEIRLQSNRDQQVAKRPIPGFQMLDFDLDKGMGGSSDYIYLFYRRSRNERPITGLEIRAIDQTPTGFIRVSGGRVSGALNSPGRGDRIYLSYTKNPDLKPIIDLRVLQQNDRLADPGWRRIDVNLNKGGGRYGDNIFLWYRR